MIALALACALAAAGPPLVIEDPEALAALEARGAGAGPLAFDVDAASTQALEASPRFRTVVAALRSDLEAIARADPHFGVGMRFTHRGFDLSWLSSSRARFDLVAVVNRVDRRPFHLDARGAQAASCGELRFVYRLAYDTETKSGPFSSRLPMTLNVVYLLDPADDPGCARASAILERDVVAEAHALRRAQRRKSVELNVQTVRWPSTVRPDLGGHAEYVLRVFHDDDRGAALVEAPLENTPDLARIQRDPALKERALAWLRDPITHTAARGGLALMPSALAATRAVSVTPRGMARAQNRPFTQLARALGAGDVDGDVLRRLDALSCMGCHQARSVAGFHMLGAERDPARRVDALAVAHSPHVEDELARRRAVVDALVAHRAPVDARPSAERADPSAAAGGFGAACGLSRFPAWTCAPDHECVAVDDDEVGQCMPRAPTIGAACVPGRVDFTRDRIARPGDRACAASAVCEDVPVGFPGGMCAGPCEDLAPGATCGAIALLTPFNTCLARGELFSTCAAHARPAALRSCDAANACRPDYICAKTPSGKGACLPPYFVLQMRVDGHPKLRDATPRQPRSR